MSDVLPNSGEEGGMYSSYMSAYYARDPRAARTHERKLAWLQHNYSSYLVQGAAVHCLEIGPGKGELLEWLSARGMQVHAIDLSEEVVEHCNHVLPGSVELVTDSIEYLRSHVDKFDLIFMLHVLEHVRKQDVLPLLRAVRMALKPGGRLVVEVPNMAHPLIGVYMRYVDFTHEVGFTSESLEFVLVSSGFADVVTRPAEMPPDRWYRALQFGAMKIVALVHRIIGLAVGVRTPTVTSHSIYATGVRNSVITQA